jgi:hypothetical protein
VRARRAGQLASAAVVFGARADCWLRALAALHAALADVPDCGVATLDWAEVKIEAPVDVADAVAARATDAVRGVFADVLALAADGRSEPAVAPLVDAQVRTSWDW